MGLGLWAYSDFEFDLCSFIHVTNVYKNEAIQTGSALVLTAVTGNSLSHLVPIKFTLLGCALC